MPISFRCSGCGKEYRVSEKMAGRRATCRCGATTRVPEEGAGETDESLDDWVAAAFRPPPKASPPPEPEPDATTNPKPQEEPPPLPDERPEPTEPCLDEPAPRYKLVGVASIVYGSLAALAVAVGVADFYVSIFDGIAGVVLAGAIGVGGVFILKRRRQGPACAGLACIFLCVLFGWRPLLALLGSLTQRRLDIALPLLAGFVIAAPVPIAIIVWSLRVEMERQRREEEEEEL